MNETYEGWNRLHPGEPVPCVIYDRESSKMQGGTDGPRQDECREFAARNGLRVVEVFHDKATSGTSIHNREAYLRLKAEAVSKNRRFCAVLVFSSSRWGRGDDSEMDMMFLEQRGIRFISATEAAFSIGGIHGELVRGIMSKLNKFYSGQLGETTRHHMSQNAKAGLSNGGAAPDGYVLVPVLSGRKNVEGKPEFTKKLALDEQPGPCDLTKEPRWKMIRAIFEKNAKGLGLKTICRELKAEGWRSRRAQDRKWREKNGKACQELIGPSTVRVILRNPRYTGFEVWNVKRWRRVEGKRRWTENSTSEWAWSKERSHPPIVSREDFERAYNRYSIKRDRTSVRRQLFAGLLKCECGSSLVVGSTRVKTVAGEKKEFSYLVCGKKPRLGWQSCPTKPVRLDLVERVVEREVLNLMTDPVVIEDFLDKFTNFVKLEAIRDKTAKMEAEKEVIKLREEIKGLTATIVAAGVNGVTLVDELKWRKDRLLEVERILNDPTPEPKLLKATKIGDWTIPAESGAKPDARHWATNARLSYKFSGPEQRREIMRHVVRQVVVRECKSGEITFDPAALLTLRRVWPELPAELPVAIKTGCGGWI